VRTRLTGLGETSARSREIQETETTEAEDAAILEIAIAHSKINWRV